MKHPVLGKHLVEISNALLNHNDKTANKIFGAPDDLKLCSSMTLFNNVAHANPVFKKVIDKYFKGSQDGFTLQILNKNELYQ